MIGHSKMKKIINKAVDIVAKESVRIVQNHKRSPKKMIYQIERMKGCQILMLIYNKDDLLSL